MIFKNVTKLVVLLVTGLLPLYSYAAVQIEVKNKSLTEIIWSDGNSLEIRIDQEPIYTLVNASQRHLYKINTKEKKILNLSDNVKQAPHIPDVEGISIDYVLHGAGPVILGFDTELYLLK
ncbi:MAG: hypothetical protein OEM38_06195, partial [Gammaproteobacteria bacterium]|nr:hypothetical protein [Gammaproteobacteria bacterium]